MKKILISRCLLGENVRYDGGNCLIRRDLLARLKHKYELISICPEVMAGLDVPRNPIELLNGNIVNQKGENLTPIFEPVLENIKTMIKKNSIEIAIMKDFSPSCGPYKIYDGHFSGKTIFGEGIVVQILRGMGIKVISENQIEELL